jgi:polygalacturonase
MKCFVLFAITGCAAASTPTTCDPRDHGAQGDGVADDTPAFAACIASGAPVIHVPAGNYVLSDTLVVSSDMPFTLRGDGFVSNLLWVANKDLFCGTPPSQPRECS